MKLNVVAIDDEPLALKLLITSGKRLFLNSWDHSKILWKRWSF